jgi:transposase-like protein
MNNRNFLTAAQLATGSNYSLKKNQPYGARIHSDRLQAVGLVLGGMPVRVVAEQFGVCQKSVRNWIRTFSDQTIRLDG